MGQPHHWIPKRDTPRVTSFLNNMQFYHALEGKNIKDIVSNLRCTAADVCDCYDEITDSVCGVQTSKMVFELVDSNCPYAQLDDELGWLGCNKVSRTSVQKCDRVPGVQRPGHHLLGPAKFSCCMLTKACNKIKFCGWCSFKETCMQHILLMGGAGDFFVL